LAFVAFSTPPDPGVFLYDVDRGRGVTVRWGTPAVGPNAFNAITSARGNLDVAGVGGIYNYGTAALTNCTVSGNSAASAGGGIYNSGGGTLTVTDSTLSDNYAGDGGIGGGIGNSGTAALTNCTVSGNSASSSGGGIFIFPSVITQTALRNTILAGNTAPSAPDVSGFLRSQGHNLIGIGDGGSGFADTDLVGTADLPIDPMLEPLGDYGGPTQTMPPLPGSPVLNAGDPSQLGVADQRGVVRTGGVNIGAYQASASTFLLIAPDAIQAGVPFSLSVTAVDPYGQVAYGYTGTVTFTCDDSAAVLPDDYQFQPSDQGSAVFAMTLNTQGPVHLTVTDSADDAVFAALDLVVL
jgi:hypothetical protein